MCLMIALVFLAVATVSGQAHEFWIAPKTPNAKADLAIKADVRVGENLLGNPQVFLPSDVHDAGHVDAAGRHKLSGTAGDQPVFNIAAPKQGLSILYYEATPGSVDWDDAAKFEKYLKQEGLTGILTDHKNRGLPDVGFSENFLRHAKALVVRGKTTGNDTVLGLDYEIVLKTPLEQLGPGVQARAVVLWQGQPVKSAAVNVFASNGGDVVKQQVQTNEKGIATFQLSDNTFYLINAVRMVPVNNREKTYWQSHWASLTFAVGTVATR